MPSGTVLFVEGSPSVFINCPKPTNGQLLSATESVAYLMNASRDILLKVESDTESATTEIVAERQCFIRAYALHAFERDPASLSSPAVADMCYYSAGLAKVYANRLWKRNIHMYPEYPNNHAIRSHVYKSPGLEEACKLLLGPSVYNKQATFNALGVTAHAWAL
jgi:hypothetical protein